jgi:hypothetical protein
VAANHLLTLSVCGKVEKIFCFFLLFEALSLIVWTMNNENTLQDTQLLQAKTDLLAAGYSEKQVTEPTATKLLKWIGFGISVLCGCGVVVVCVLGSPSVAIISSGSALLYGLIGTGGIALGVGSFLIFHFRFQPPEIAVTIKKHADGMKKGRYGDEELRSDIGDICSQYKKCYDDVNILDEDTLSRALSLQQGRQLADIVTDGNTRKLYREFLSCVLNHLRKSDTWRGGGSKKKDEFIAIISQVLAAEQFPSDAPEWMKEEAQLQQQPLDSMKVKLTVYYALKALQLGGLVPGIIWPKNVDIPNNNEVLSQICFYTSPVSHELQEQHVSQDTSSSESSD